MFVSLHYRIGALPETDFQQALDYDIDDVQISTKKGEEILSFQHYEPAAGQKDKMTVLSGLGTFGNNNQVKVQDIRVDQGSFNLNKYENIY